MLSFVATKLSGAWRNSAWGGWFYMWENTAGTVKYTLKLFLFSLILIYLSGKCLWILVRKGVTQHFLSITDKNRAAQDQNLTLLFVPMTNASQLGANYQVSASSASNHVILFANTSHREPLQHFLIWSAGPLISRHTCWLVLDKTCWDGDERHCAFFQNWDQTETLPAPVSHEIFNRNHLSVMRFCLTLVEK